MTTFLLIHGGGHRGWHWNLLQAELERLGHQSIAPDVPMDDPAVGAGTWADVAFDALGSSPLDDVIVVGHSYAGLCLPVIGAKGPFRRLVFLAADVPVPGRTYADYTGTGEGAESTTLPPLEFDEHGRILLTFPVAREAYYGDVEEGLALAAWERLTPNATTAFTELCPIATWPDIPCSYILCTEDRIRGSHWARRISIERFGSPAIELPGGHSPMLSRPADLAKALDGLARL